MLVRGERHTKGRKGSTASWPQKSSFFQPSGTPDHFSRVLTREGFSYGLSTNFDASWWRLSPCQQQTPGLGTAGCPRLRQPTARAGALPPLPSGPK